MACTKVTLCLDAGRLQTTQTRERTGKWQALWALLYYAGLEEVTGQVAVQGGVQGTDETAAFEAGPGLAAC